MIAFFSILVGSALLGVTVYGLHRYQTMEVGYQVDRTMPLPSLKRESQPNFLERTRSGNQDSAAELESGAAITLAVKQEAAVKPEVDIEPASHPNSWQTRVSAAKRNGDISKAMALCSAQQPLWGAFNQLCILLRGQLKKAGLEETEKQKP